ncbi:MULTISPECIES: hypothetical protein [unclassified Nonomuraea]|uniref:hypothetical protein n=1 Tax=unclassified Nonomuraea TaxID=2593643 RepID=UPI001376C5B9|nr:MULTISPECIES: hypothetical protein [unclassified Nonomuraea]NBE93065.1 hypothetical protein [Nonomuraea sp. K271]
MACTTTLTLLGLGERSRTILRAFTGNLWMPPVAVVQRAGVAHPVSALLVQQQRLPGVVERCLW